MSHANSIVSALSKLFGPVIHSIEFTYFVVVADPREELPDLLSRSQLSEMGLLDSQLSIA